MATELSLLLRVALGRGCLLWPFGSHVVAADCWVGNNDVRMFGEFAKIDSHSTCSVHRDRESRAKVAKVFRRTPVRGESTSMAS